MIKQEKGLGVFAWKRLILTIAVLLMANGIFAWFSTPQEEDPRLRDRDGIVTVIYPGAIPSDMERLIAKPIEDELAQVEDIKTVTTRLRTDFMFMQVKLKDSVATDADIHEVWRKVQDALDRAQRKLPETAGTPELNKEIYDQDAVLLALSGTADRLTLLDQARLLKDRLQLLPTVKSIDQVGSPREQLSVVFNREKLARYGVSLENLVKQLQGGNASIPSGYVKVGEMKVSVLTNSFYRSSEELKRFPVSLKSGDTMPLSELAQIERTPMIPVIESARQNGKPAMVLGVVAQHNVNMTQFGEAVRDVVKEFESSPEFKASGLKIEEISFQPHYVEERIFDIGMDLLKAIFLVGGVLMLMLGFRVGAIVALQVPFVTAIAFGIFARGGGVLNQISIVAFILAIGLLVDNVVVVVDGIQQKLDQGLSPIEAGEQTRKEYLIPLAAGTLTTVAAFTPILLSKGTTADFTRAIGSVATIALICSYIFCILCTPIVAAFLLRKGKARQWNFVGPLGARLGSWVERFPKQIVIAATLAVLIAFLGFKFVKKQFFPYADRDLVIVDMQLQEGTHYKTTEQAVSDVENEIKKDPRVVSVTTFVGRGVPPFYYNLPREPNAPHIAQMIVRLHGNKEAKAFRQDQEAALAKLVPFGTLMVKEIAQGPVVRAPIEVRVYSQDPEKLQKAANQVLAAVRKAPAIYKVRSTLGTGMMSYRLDINDSAAGNFGASRAEVSSVILANTRGIPITTYRGGYDPYSINLMSKKGEESSIADIQNGYMGNTRTDTMTVGTLTSESIQFSPSILEHRNRVPVVYVFAELPPGSPENLANEQVKDLISKLHLEEGVSVEMGGANAESADANKAMALAVPFGLIILLSSLMFEFNSFRRVGIILLTIPLCAVGSVPGLILSGSTFGFVTLLGFFTLGGTVIHNGIFLLDYIDHRIHDGIPLNQALTEGIQRRTRPIILTAVATMVELFPMTLSKSTLWPPFAWAIISGLMVSTLMTLLVIPSVYKLVFEREVARSRHGQRPEPGRGHVAKTAAHAVLIALVVLGGVLVATPKANAANAVTMKDVIEKAKNAPESNASRSEGEKAEQEAKAVSRATFMPKVTGLGVYDRLSSPVGINNPISPGSLPPSLAALGAPLPTVQDSVITRAEISQPLLDVPGMFYGSPAANRLAEAGQLKAKRGVQDQQEKALSYYLQILSLRAKREALEHYVENLKARQIEIRRLYELGDLSEADVLKVKLGIADAQQGIREIREQEELLGSLLCEAIGDKGSATPVDLPHNLPAALAPNPGSPDQRSDIQALGKQIESTELQSKAASLTYVPRIEAFAGYTYFKQDVLTQNNWGDVGVRLSWAIFDGGIGRAKSSALAAERTALEARKESAVTQIGAEADSAQRMLTIKREEYLDRLRGVEDAKHASEVDFRRLRQGKVTVTDVVDAEDLLKDREEKAALSKIGWYQEWFRYQSAAGSEFSVP